MTSTVRPARPRLILTALASCGVLVSISQTLVVPLLSELPRITHRGPADVSWRYVVRLFTSGNVAGIVAGLVLLIPVRQQTPVHLEGTVGRT